MRFIRLSGRTLEFGVLRLRFHPLVALCIVLAAAGLFRLGLWQLDRAGEKLALQQSFLDMQAMAAAPLDALPLAGRERDARLLQDRHVSLQGEYLNERSIFLIYQSHEEQVGYEIVTPFELDGSGMIALVSRGWTGAASYEQLAELLPPVPGPQRLEGTLYVPTAAEAARTNVSFRERWPLLIRYLNTSELAPLFDAPLFPYVVRLDAGQPGVLVRHWPAVRVDMDRNVSYAFQWFAMGLAVLIASLILSSNILQLMQRKKRREPERGSQP